MERENAEKAAPQGKLLVSIGKKAKPVTTLAEEVRVGLKQKSPGADRRRRGLRGRL